MAFSKARRLSDFIAADGTIPTGKFASGTITSAHIANLGITHADLHTNMDLTGKTVLVANASTGDNDTTAANTAFVQQEIAALVDSSPSALNTLNELAAALGDDANFSTTVNANIATKLPLAGGTMTGDLIFGDDVKVEIGSASGGDLQLYHSGGNSYIKNETGWLNMPMGGNGVSIANSDFSEILAKFVVNGAAELYHNGSKKLETTSVGVTVTGDLGVKSDGGSDVINVVHSGNTVKLASIGQSSDNSGNGLIQLRRNNGVLHTQIHSHGHTYFGGGNVGIGFASGTPRYDLVVAGDSTTAIGIGVDNTSGSSTLDIAALGTGYNNHQAGPGEVWFFSPDTINIGGATGDTNDVKFLANNSVNMIVKGATGRVGIGVTSPSANLQINGSTDAGGGTQNVMVKNETTATYSSTAFVGTGRVLDFITNSNDNQDFSAIRFANVGGSRETAILVVEDNITTRDGTGQGDVVIQGYDGDGYIETQRFRANGSSSSTGQRRTGSYTSFAYINHTYTFDHNNYASAGTPANSNPHWLEIPLYSAYSSSAGGGWCEIDICWHASHAQAGHLHTWKLVWGSHHGYLLNVAVVSNSATATAGSYNPYAFTSHSALYRHPTAGANNMTKLYIRIKGSTNHSGGRSITLRGVGHPSAKNLAPIIDHNGDNTPDGITPTHIQSQQATG
jgi:hypothetical protein